MSLLVIRASGARAALTILAAAALAGSAAAEAPTPADEGAVIERLAFGSCADQNRPQPIWRAIAATEPQLFLFLGDNIYADTLDMEKMAADYAKLAAVPEFRRFRDRVPILATWDDHDYGANDGGAGYPKKEDAKRLFLDFFGEPEGSARRERPGIYQAKIFGPPGRRLQIILLDGRTFRSRLERDPSPRRRYRPSTDASTTMLGEAQWTWLEEQLRVPAEIRLIGSGVQVLGYAFGFESWKTLPHEQERLFRVIRETGANGVIFLSGDAHFAQLKRGDGGSGYPFYEFTASGLTHGNPRGARRLSPLAVYPAYGGLNFGTLDIAWSEATEITFTAHDQGGNPVFHHRIRLADLAWPEEMD